jgi:hypothetical protein
MKRLVIVCALVNCTLAGMAQDPNERSTLLSIGIEQDILPYVFGGYFTNVWIGKGHLRSRLIAARVHKPDFLIKEPFTNNVVHAYAITGDYFIKENWEGWWAGAGLVLWRNSLQTTARMSIAHFDSWLLNGSVGYNWKFCRTFYAGPWAGLHILLAGNKNVVIDQNPYKVPVLNPEASVKVGWYFGR